MQLSILDRGIEQMCFHLRLSQLDELGNVACNWFFVAQRATCNSMYSITNCNGVMLLVCSKKYWLVSRPFCLFLRCSLVMTAVSLFPMLRIINSGRLINLLDYQVDVLLFHKRFLHILTVDVATTVSNHVAFAYLQCFSFPEEDLDGSNEVLEKRNL